MPKSLINILDTLLDNNGIRSWQIYSEKVGVTLKIRFNECNSTGGQKPTTDLFEGQPKVNYTKKTPSRQRRDSKRATSGRILRSMKQDNNISDIEKPRRDSYSQAVVGQIGIPCSPIDPVSDQPATSTPVCQLSSQSYLNMKAK